MTDQEETNRRTGEASDPEPAQRSRGARPDAHKRIMDLRVDRIDPNPGQPRRHMNDESLESLAASIRRAGVLQPILVKRKNTRFEIIAGERRWRAAQRAGLETIPAIVKEIDDQGYVFEIALIENIQREDLSSVEKGAAYARLMDEFGYTQEELAERVGKSRSTIANTLRLLELEPEIQADIQARVLSEGLARTLLGVSGDDRRRLWRQLRKGGISVRQAEKLVHCLPKEVRRKDSTLNSAPGNLRYIIQTLEELLGSRVRIYKGEKRGIIEIEYTSDADLARVLDIILKKKLS